MTSHNQKRFRNFGFVLYGLLSVVVYVIAVGPTYGQTLSKKINPYSPSPAITLDRVLPRSGPAERSEVVFVTNSAPDKVPVEQLAPNVDVAAAAAPSIYLVGAGDVLSVHLPDSGRMPSYYTVKADGSIDFPLAGGDLSVIGQTVNQIASIISARVTLYKNTRTDVRVREYASHRITVGGMVERPGDKYMQREAIPLYVIRAESGVNTKATRAIITRGATGPKETILLDNAAADSTLVYPGNSVEFVADNSTGSGLPNLYYISGEVASTGQKTLGANQTLYQAVVAAGGTKGDPKKAVIRRRDAAGKLTSVEHKLKSIKDGKVADPVIFAGDVIEIVR